MVLEGVAPLEDTPESVADWDHLLAGDVEVHKVTGDHDRLRDKQEVQTWAVKLSIALSEAQAHYSTEMPVEMSVDA